jgi:TatA/E family protein of Tat protein translocase
MFYLFIFEFLGTTELMVILVVALILFGPRKLPQLSRSLGKSLGEFKRASEEFKQTWEREVAMESVEKEREIERAMLPEENSILAPTIGREKKAQVEAAALDAKDEAGVSVAAALPRATGEAAIDAASHASSVDATAPEPTRKRDWL